jgi:hypothetical protein
VKRRRKGEIKGNETTKTDIRKYEGEYKNQKE